MNKGEGKIENLSVVATFDVPYVAPITTNDSSNILANYGSSSHTTFIDAGGNMFLPTDLSNIPTIYNLVAPTEWGNTIFQTTQTAQVITLYMDGEKSEEILINPNKHNSYY